MTQYKYNSSDLVRGDMSALTERERFLLTESQTFCIYPWIHIHAYPTGEAYPCCHAEMGVGQIGNCRTDTLKDIWNSPAQKKLRTDMLTETPNAACGRCYEQEKSGFFTGRQSANKHHGHHIDRVQGTDTTGHTEQFEMTYWDIRFSNLCNLKCRSCGHIFSSQWYQDQAKLAGGSWKAENKVLNYAGRTETDMWEQLLPHLDYVEQIYFAGGEPLMMAEHYNILDELERRGRFDVRLIYNTNFTQTRLKDRTVFDYWRKFDSVAVGASLDASGPRGEYIRKGTDWAVVESNRRQMMEVCPKVDFYISPTLSIMNALHLPDFHKDWVEKGLLTPQDLNVNILQDPAYLRIDIAPTEYKQRIQSKYEQHLEWLRPLDQLNRATVGFESAITFMNSTDNTHLLDTFWRKTHELDSIRREHVLDVLPELRAIK
jgi:radical SAM protein with 4Fe4S-binding SPASM domain